MGNPIKKISARLSTEISSYFHGQLFVHKPIKGRGFGLDPGGGIRPGNYLRTEFEGKGAIARESFLGVFLKALLYILLAGILFAAITGATSSVGAKSARASKLKPNEAIISVHFE